jgi:hypothetical protein
MRLDGRSERVAPGEHASADDLALFVIDALAAPARQRLEGHVVACPSCASALAAEAAAEQALQAVWPVVRSGEPRRAGRAASSNRPLAEVVALPRPRPAVGAAVRPAAPARVAYQSSLGGLAAAVVTVLFLGWWTDAGRLMTNRSLDAGRLGPPLTACLLPGDRPGGDDARFGICAAAPPSLGAMASWGMCALGAPARPGGVCRSLPDLVCAPPDGE